MKHDPPDPPELGERDGLSYALFVPEGEPKGGVVILHGAGSAKESHFDFGRAVPRPTTWPRWPTTRAATAARRASGDRRRSATRSRCATCCASTRPKVALRGSSMGGFTAIHAAALDPSVAAVVALCPAPRRLLLRGLRSGRLQEFAVDARGHRAVARGPGPLRRGGRARRRRPRCCCCTRKGDEQVPYTVSEELHAAAHEPKRLLVFPGGHHRSLQHDLEVQNLSAPLHRAGRSR